MTGVDERMRAEGLDPGSWSNGPGDRYGAPKHGYDKAIVCAAGSIVFGLPDRGTSIQLATGDRLDLPAGVRHDALAGPQGVRCLEAHLAEGTFDSPLRRGAGEW